MKASNNRLLELLLQNQKSWRAPDQSQAPAKGVSEDEAQHKTQGQEKAAGPDQAAIDHSNCSESVLEPGFYERCLK